MILGMHDAKTQFITVCLAEVLRKIEGKMFLSEADVIHEDHDTTISIIFDDKKGGWWVELHDPSENRTDPEWERAANA